MIKIYPSALDGEPIETHKLKKKKRICDFLVELAPSFTLNRNEHPISIAVNGKNIPPNLWDTFYLKPKHTVAITVQPKAAVIIIAAIVAVAAAAYSFYAMRQAKKGKGERDGGKSLDGADINANIARWGDPIPEIAGSPLSYPALLTPIHRWYKTDSGAQWHATEYAEMLLCIGKGEYEVGLKDVYIGETPALLLGDKVEIQFFDAGASLSGVSAAKWWHESDEVGFTTFGGTGITLGVTTELLPYWSSIFTHAGSIITGESAVPSDWVTGVVIQNIHFDHYINFGSDYISSPYLDSISAGVGDTIFISNNAYTITSVNQPTPTEGEPQPSSIRYKLDNMDNLPTGTHIRPMAAGTFTVLAINGASIQVQPTSVSGVWSGFPSGTILNDLNLSAASMELGWAGAFRVTPEYTPIDKIEVDILYPQGLIRYNSEGSSRNKTAGGTIQYRRINLDGKGGTVGAWQSYTFSNTGKTPNQIGFTYSIDVACGEYEVRVQADEPPSDSTSTNNTQQWTRLKGRVVVDKMNYPDMTVMSVKMQSGDAVGGSVENKVKVRARRILPTLENPAVKEATSDIAPFFVYMLSTVGYTREFIDIEAITELHNEYWVDNERFDMAFSASTTLKDAANTVLKAGFSEITIKDGLITAVQDKVQLGLPTRIFSPQEYTEPLTQTIQAVQPDEIDGVDAEYIEYKTGKKVTESFRLFTDAGSRVEKITLHGITGKTAARRHAERRRRELAYRRIEYSGATELHAMNCQYGDFIGLQDGVPQYGQSAFVLRHSQNKGNLVLRMSEPIAETADQLVGAIRKPDGRVTAPFQARVSPTNPRDVTLLDAAHIEVTGLQGNKDATVVYFGGLHEFYYPAVITEIKPTSNKVYFTAVGYDARVYTETTDGDYITNLCDPLPPGHLLPAGQLRLASQVFPLYYAEKMQSKLQIKSLEYKEMPTARLSDKMQASLAIDSLEYIERPQPKPVDTMQANLVISSIELTPPAETRNTDKMQASLAIDNLEYKLHPRGFSTDKMSASLSIESLEYEPT